MTETVAELHDMAMSMLALHETFLRQGTAEGRREIELAATFASRALERAIERQVSARTIGLLAQSLGSIHMRRDAWGEATAAFYKGLSTDGLGLVEREALLELAHEAEARERFETQAATDQYNELVAHASGGVVGFGVMPARQMVQQLTALERFVRRIFCWIVESAAADRENRAVRPPAARGWHHMARWLNVHTLTPRAASFETRVQVSLQSERAPTELAQMELGNTGMGALVASRCYDALVALDDAGIDGMADVLGSEDWAMTVGQLAQDILPSREDVERFEVRCRVDARTQARTFRRFRSEVADDLTRRRAEASTDVSAESRAQPQATIDVLEGVLEAARFSDASISIQGDDDSEVEVEVERDDLRDTVAAHFGQRVLVDVETRGRSKYVLLNVRSAPERSRSRKGDLFG